MCESSDTFELGVFKDAILDEDVSVMVPSASVCSNVCLGASRRHQEVADFGVSHRRGEDPRRVDPVLGEQRRRHAGRVLFQSGRATGATGAAGRRERPRRRVVGYFGEAGLRGRGLGEGEGHRVDEEHLRQFGARAVREVLLPPHREHDQQRLVHHQVLRGVSHLCRSLPLLTP
jgi:hypothetical protein